MLQQTRVHSVGVAQIKAMAHGMEEVNITGARVNSGEAGLIAHYFDCKPREPKLDTRQSMMRAAQSSDMKLPRSLVKSIVITQTLKINARTLDQELEDGQLNLSTKNVGPSELTMICAILRTSAARNVHGVNLSHNHRLSGAKPVQWQKRRRTRGGGSLDIDTDTIDSDLSGLKNLCVGMKTTQVHTWSLQFCNLEKKSLRVLYEHFASNENHISGLTIDLSGTNTVCDAFANLKRVCLDTRHPAGIVIKAKEVEQGDYVMRWDGKYSSGPCIYAQNTQ